MPVRKRPTAPATVQEFIHAANSDNTGTSIGESIIGVKLRVPAQLLAQVDDAVGKRRPVPSRHQWLLEAIYEKVQRES